MLAIFYGRGFKETSRLHAQIDVDLRDHLHEFWNGKNANALVVFLEIALHVNEGGWAWPSRNTIKSKTGIRTERALTAALAHLRKMRINDFKVLEHYRIRTKGQWGRSAYLVFPEVSHGKNPWLGLEVYDPSKQKPIKAEPVVGDPLVGEPPVVKPPVVDPPHEVQPYKVHKHSEKPPNAESSEYVPLEEIFDDKPRVSELASFIGQQMRSPVSQSNRTKLGMTYTEHRKTGNVVHGSPDVLWDSNNHVFRDFVEARLDYWKGESGSAAQKRNKAINQICNYGHYYGWLNYSAAFQEATGEVMQDTEVRQVKVDVPTADFLEKAKRVQL